MNRTFRGLLLSLLLLVIAGVLSGPVFPSAASKPAGKGRTVGVDQGDPMRPSCSLPSLVVPPTPSKIPGYAQLDPSTGLHVTGTMQSINLGTYKLEVTGKVERPLKLGYDELRCMPRVSGRPVLVCPGFFTDTASWAGVPLKYVVDLAGVKPGAAGVRLLGADKYTASLPMDVAMKAGNFLAYEWEGHALPRLHGFPLRAVLPGLEGNQWVKWIVRIEVY